MITVYVVRPKDPETKYFHQICSGFGFTCKEIQDVSEIPTDKPVLIFHPRIDNNPSWVKLEDFDSIDFIHLNDGYYVFGADGGDIMGEIEKENPQLKEHARFVRISCEEGLSLHASSACAIALYDLYMENY